MKLAVMSYTLARGRKPGDFDFAAMCRLAQELHLDGVDVVTTYGRDPREIARVIADHGIRTVCYTFMVDMSSPDPAARCKAADAIKTGVETAVVLGTDKVMIPTPGKPDVPREQVRRNIIATLQAAAPAARQAGITLTIENFPGATSPFVISDDVLEAVAAVPGLKLTLDNGNVFTGAEDLAVSIERCAAHIVHAHFKDWEITTPDQGFKGLDGRHYRGALIGEGIVDHRRCLAALQAIGYRGYIDIEYEGDLYPPEEATRRAGRYLQELIAAL